MEQKPRGKGPGFFYALEKTNFGFNLNPSYVQSFCYYTGQKCSGEYN